MNDPLVTSFVYEGNEYAIDLSFDNVLDVFDQLDDKALREHEKAEICLALLLNETTFKGEKAINLWNYIYEEFIKIESKKPIEYDRLGNPLPMKEEEEKNFINLDKDAKYIFASFKQAYNMNLFEQQGKLHWHEFQALLSGLPSDTFMQRIIQIRMWEPSQDESTEYKKAMRELQKVYALEDNEEWEEVD
ncbi:Gp15 family bacteriophage protein [Virgibacillus salarius]|uniref:Gp15 family bacteriophage protein n=1 Tax=Virgibacillus salarius TaxID=447199 RepID=UPI002493B250|nr:Gp15 family bacteriophage protein [Virgibacillus salarius]WBX81288.1 Gp15 family bacteriophage protein [Virgibacillus salarius]